MLHHSPTRSNERATGQGASLKRVFAYRPLVGTFIVVTWVAILGDFKGQENNRMQKRYRVDSWLWGGCAQTGLWL